ncbi:hypothetical protein J4Q44_G00387860 [Coregonus suidteri]|uniref:Uncharacterized protein n=1 Tax=Coregonus suidteri TaxID=861788 RepID=A0AAN8KGD5_9TELE
MFFQLVCILAASLQGVLTQDRPTQEVNTCRRTEPGGADVLRVTGCLESTDQSEERDTILVLSIVGLVAALLIFTISYVILRNMLLQRSKKYPQEPLLDAPLEKKDLMLIYTLGPNWSGQASIKHVCV